MPEPFPKVLENRAGERVTVHDFREQEAKTAEGYLRSLARNREYAEAQAAAKAAEAKD